MGITFGDHLIDSGYYDPEEETMPVEERDTGEDCGRFDQNAKGGMLPLGLCRLAGTEWCDWECPYSR
jgi:hypothetical protein